MSVSPEDVRQSKATCVGWKSHAPCIGVQHGPWRPDADSNRPAIERSSRFESEPQRLRTAALGGLVFGRWVWWKTRESTSDSEGNSTGIHTGQSRANLILTSHLRGGQGTDAEAIPRWLFTSGGTSAKESGVGSRSCEIVPAARWKRREMGNRNLKHYVVVDGQETPVEAHG
jgi:hypothetical protein